MKLYSQLEFISERRWEKALFTTYALSLTFFETYLLPALRKAGCEEITILVDVDGYRSTLMEQRSRHVGQEYSLIPVDVKHGIFHPKTTYLWSPEGDLLMVGSGNVTFGGNGRNIEVLEVLNPIDDSDSFSDYATFLDDLALAKNISIPSGEAIKQFSRRAKKSGMEFPSKGMTRLLNTLNSTISEQLIERSSEIKQWDELLVLSPFHHTHGTPVLELAKGIGVKKLVIGVSPHSEEETSFPFDEAKKWNMDISIVAPKVEQPKRHLHAKWFELRGSQTWSLTGSVNATAQSLTTTKNVEVGVLRILKSPSIDYWKIAKKPVFKADSFIDSEGISCLSIYAELDANGHVQGRILGVGKLEGEWHAYLDKADELINEAKLMVNNEGTFVWPLITFSEFENASALQLRLIKGDLTARGWVIIQNLLKLPSRSRIAINALSRMLSRTESPDDINALMDYIAFHAGRVATIASNLTKSSSNRPIADTEDFSFSIKDLYISEDSSEASLFRDLASSAKDENKSWHVIQTIAKLLLGKQFNTTSSGQPLRRHSSPVVDDEDDEKIIYHTQFAINEFNDRIRDTFNHTQAGDAKLAQLLFVWLSVNLDMHLRRLNDKHEAYLIAEEWMKKVSRAEIPIEARSLLDEAVFGIAASLAWHAKDSLPLAKSFYGITLDKSLIHQWLESYSTSSLDKELAISKATSWFTHEVALLLVDGKSDDAIKQLQMVIEQPTIRGILSSIINAVREISSPVIPEDIFNLDEKALIQKLIKSRGMKLPYRLVNHHKQTGCPNCYVALIKDVKTRLSTRRITECIECKSILISLVP